MEIGFSIAAVLAAAETDCGGSTMTAGYGNLAESHAAKQRARKTHALCLSNASMLTMHKEAMIASSRGELVTAAAAQEDTALVISSQQGVSVDHIPTPANWPFSLSGKNSLRLKCNV